MDVTPARIAAESVLGLGRLQRALYPREFRDGFEPVDTQILVALWLDSPVTVGEIAATVGVKPQSASRSLGRLTAKGFVRPVAATADRRHRSHELTRAGVRRALSFLAFAETVVAQTTNPPGATSKE